MKRIIFAAVFSGFMAISTVAISSGFFCSFCASNNSAGPGGNLQDLSSVDLTDCCGGALFAR